MRIRAALAALAVVVCANSIEQPVQAKSLVQGIEQSLNRINRQLCANMPSSKCKKFRATSKHKSKAKPKDSSAAPVTVPPKALPVIPAAPVTHAVVPRLAPPLPKPRPADLNTDIHARAHKTPAIVLPPPAVAKAAPPAVVAPVTPPAPPPPAEAKPALPAVVAPVIPPVPPAMAEQASACLTALAATSTSFVPVPQPGRSSACQIDTPVRLNSLSTKAGVVKLPDLPTVNCAFALKLSQFVNQRVQTLAQQSSGSAVTAMGTGPGFDCRGRNGDSSAKLSEHGIGNAVDIVYFKFANKSQIFVKDALNVQSPSFGFLRDIRAAACDEFTTVLGPGANKAHAEHFHIDLEVRGGGYRLCE